MARHALKRRTRLLAACIINAALFVAATGASGGEADELAVGPASAFEAPASERTSTTVETLSKKEQRRRLRELSKMANRWYGERRRFPTRCHHCDGRGSILILHPRTNATPLGYEARKDRIRNKRRSSAWHVVGCPTCKGQRVYLSKKSFMKAYYEMMSPAFRLLPRAREMVEGLYESVCAGERPLPRKFAFASQKRAVLTTPTRGIIWHRIQGEKTWQPTFWVWAAADGRKSTWFQYAAEADGDWPAADRELPQPAGYPQLP